MFSRELSTPNNSTISTCAENNIEMRYAADNSRKNLSQDANRGICNSERYSLGSRFMIPRSTAPRFIPSGFTTPRFRNSIAKQPVSAAADFTAISSHYNRPHPKIPIARRELSSTEETRYKLNSQVLLGREVSGIKRGVSFNEYQCAASVPLPLNKKHADNWPCFDKHSEDYEKEFPSLQGKPEENRKDSMELSIIKTTEMCDNGTSWSDISRNSKSECKNLCPKSSSENIDSSAEAKPTRSSLCLDKSRKKYGEMSSEFLKVLDEEKLLKYFNTDLNFVPFPSSANYGSSSYDFDATRRMNKECGNKILRSQMLESTKSGYQNRRIKCSENINNREKSRQTSKLPCFVKTLEEYEEMFPKLPNTSSDDGKLLQDCNTGFYSVLIRSSDESANVVPDDVCEARNENQSFFTTEAEWRRNGKYYGNDPSNNEIYQEEPGCQKLTLILSTAAKVWETKCDYLKYPLLSEILLLFERCWEVREDDDGIAASPFHWKFLNFSRPLSSANFNEVSLCE